PGTGRTAGAAFESRADAAIAREPDLAVRPREEASQLGCDADRDVADHETRAPLERDRRGGLQMVRKQRQAGRQGDELVGIHVEPGEAAQTDRPHPDVREDVDGLDEVRHRRPRHDDLGHNGHPDVHGSADRPEGRLQRARLRDEPVVCVPARRVEGDDQALYARGAQPPDDRGRHAGAHRAEPEISGPQLRETLQQRREVGAAKWVSAAYHEGTRAAVGGARGGQNVARGDLLARGTAAPRQAGGTANQRQTEIDAPDPTCRARTPSVVLARRRRMVETRVHVATSVPAGDGYHIARSIRQGFPSMTVRGCRAAGPGPADPLEEVGVRSRFSPSPPRGVQKPPLRIDPRDPLVTVVHPRFLGRDELLQELWTTPEELQRICLGNGAGDEGAALRDPRLPGRLRERSRSGPRHGTCWPRRTVISPW